MTDQSPSKFEQNKQLREKREVLSQEIIARHLAGLSLADASAVLEKCRQRLKNVAVIPAADGAETAA